MRVVDLAQNTAEWEKWREGGLGASDAPSVLGLSPWTTSLQLWNYFMGFSKKQGSNFAMRRGQFLEPKVRFWYECKVDHPFPPICCQHDDYPWLRASLDGFDFLSNTILEIKCPKQRLHQEALEGKIPQNYLPQLYHQLLVTDATKVVYLSYSENQIFSETERYAIVELSPKPEILEYLLFREICFWGMVQSKKWFNMDTLAEYQMSLFGVNIEGAVQ